jgi:hypothetical protein
MLGDESWKPSPNRMSGPAVPLSIKAGSPSVCGVVAAASRSGDSSRQPSTSSSSAAYMRDSERALVMPCAAGTSAP